MPKRKQASAVRPTVVVQQNNSILYLILGVLVIALGFMFFRMYSLEKKLTATTGGTTQQAPPPTTISLDKIKPLFGSGYMHFGDAKSKLLFVEVSDPSCPYCHAAGGQDPQISKQIAPTFQYVTDGGSYLPPVTEMRKLVDEGKASYVQIYAPGHGSGELGAQAFYCAYEKGKFWEVHDKLMSFDGYNLMNDTVKNDLVNLPKLADFLAGVIDPNFLSACVQSGKYAKTLQRDAQVAQSIGYQGTPHFIVNTQIYPGAVSFNDMKSVVDKAL
jgi:protein-disulfide isomerase